MYAQKRKQRNHLELFLEPHFYKRGNVMGLINIWTPCKIQVKKINPRKYLSYLQEKLYSHQIFNVTIRQILFYILIYLLISNKIIKNKKNFCSIELASVRRKNRFSFYCKFYSYLFLLYIRKLERKSFILLFSPPTFYRSIYTYVSFWFPYLVK